MTSINKYRASWLRGDNNRCRHCKERLSKHTEERACLFAPTRFAAMTEEQYSAWFVGPYARMEMQGVDQYDQPDAEYVHVKRKQS